MADKKDCEGASSRENSVSRISGVDSRYLATLQPQDRKRFQEKLKYVVDGELLEIQNPYETWNAPSWSDKPTAWPEIEFGDLWGTPGLGFFSWVQVDVRGGFSPSCCSTTPFQLAYDLDLWS